VLIQNRTKSAARQLWDAVCDLIRAWWRVDRIRTSPNDGRLLRLDFGSILDVGQQRVEVIDRVVSAKDTRLAIAYHCRTSEENTRLFITANRFGEIESCVWEVNGTRRDIHHHDIDVVI
jgi:hypothetical protein